MSEERFIATLVGCAIGDALGMPVEGWPKARIQKHVGRITEMLNPIILRDDQGNKITEDEFGKLQYWTETFKKGEYTDDTILTLAIAESIIERGLPDIHHITQKQLEIYAAGRNKCGFGGTTKAAFENVIKGISPLKSGVIGGPGTGPAMKMAPIGMWMATEPPITTDESCRIPSEKHTEKYYSGYGLSLTFSGGLYFASIIGESTHLDPRSIVCGVLQAEAVADLLLDLGKLDEDGDTPLRFIETLQADCWLWEKSLTKQYKWHHKGDIYSKICWIIDNMDVSVEEAHSYLGSSSAVYQAYPFTLWMFQKYWNNPIAGLEEIVNCGGDCDTTGAMFGALVGARHGMIFPKKWANQLQNLDKIINTGKRFYDLVK